MYNATKSLTSSYMTRRRTVYTKLKLGSFEPNQSQVQPKPVNNVFVSIQKWLNNYCKAGLVVDGDYGPKTKRAMIKALQHYMNTEKSQSLDENIYCFLERFYCLSASWAAFSVKSIRVIVFRI